MSEQRYKTATIVSVHIDKEEDRYIVIGRVGAKHLSGWREGEETYRLSIHTNFESAEKHYRQLWKRIGQHGSIPKTVPRDLDTYLLP